MQINRQNIYVAIMAGGIGSRFWPASRVAQPKQFLDILGLGKSLLRLTFERFLKLVPPEHILIVTNEMYKNLVIKILPEISEQQVICEPSRNNTGPCIAYTAFKLWRLNPAANFVVAPSDHLILKEDTFITHLESALSFTEKNDALCTLGITPVRPDTGYGYIHFERGKTGPMHRVFHFREKPPLEVAQAYLASGDYLWNAGIFIWRADSVLKAFQRHAPDIFQLLQKGEKYYNTPAEQEFINQYYPLTPNISVDYAIMEKAENVFTLPADIGWSDLGTWASLHAESPKDKNDNVIQGSHVMTFNVNNCIIRASNGKLLVVKDLEGYIIVDEPDALLIFPKNKEQEIRNIIKKLEEESNLNCFL